MAQTGYTPILIYASGTASNVPSASNLASGLSGAELALNYADGKLFYKDSGGVVRVLASKATGTIGGSTNQVQYNSSGSLAGSANFTFDGTSITLANNPTLSGGTANGVAYLNGSKVLTTGSALTFDGTNFGIGTASPSAPLMVLKGAAGADVAYILNAGGYGFRFQAQTGGAGTNNMLYVASGETFSFGVNNAEQMRLTSTGLGIGSSSPISKLAVQNTSAGDGITVRSTGFDTNKTGATNALLIGADSSTGINYIVGGGSASNTQIAFYTAAGAAPAEQMRLTSTGLGIGTNSPSSKLEILNGGDAIVTVTGNTASGNFASVDFKRNTGTVNAAVRSQSVGGNDIGELYFVTRPSLGSLTERMRIGGAGNVTINAPSSGTALQVTAAAASAYAIRATATTSGSSSFVASPGSLAGVAYAFDTNGTTGIYQSAVNTVDISTVGAQRVSVAAAGNVTINAPSSGNAMTLKGLSATDILQIQSTTGAAGNLAAGWAAGINVGQWNIYSTSTDSITLGCQGTAGITFATSSANRATISAAGNVTINAPSSGTALSVSSGSLPDSAITVYTTGDITTNGPSSYLRFNYNNNANSGGYIGYGGFANQLEIYNYLNGPISFITNSIERAKIDGSGTLLVGAQTNTESSKVLTAAAKTVSVGIPTNQLAVYDTTAMAAGVGGAINFIGNYTSGGASTSFASIEASKENSTSGSFGAAMVFKTRVNGGSQTEAMRIDSSQSLLVGTTSASFNSSNSTFFYPTDGYWVVNHANGTSTGTRYIGFGYNTGEIGSITQSGTTAVLYNTTSDQRLKDNITDADSASDVIDAIKVRQFDWKSDGSHQRYGMIAQELYEVAPEAVHAPSDPDDMMSVDYSKLVPMLVKEIQSLRQRLAVLEGKA